MEYNDGKFIIYLCNTSSISRYMNVSFRRGLANENQTTWFDLVSKVAQVHLTKRKDVFCWNLSKNGLFTVRSMYKTLIT